MKCVSCEAEAQVMDNDKGYCVRHFYSDTQMGRDLQAMRWRRRMLRRQKVKA